VRQDHHLDEAQLKKLSMVRFERPLPSPIAPVWHLLADTARLPERFGDGRSVRGMQVDHEYGGAGDHGKR
jgi:uncharacterized protein YndB with AHSA1/START domain